jgi:hypothetical protein
MKDIFARYFKKIAVQVCTVQVLIMYVFLPVQLLCVLLICPAITYIQELILVTDCCFFFRRFKINHYSYEFILKSGTVPNSKYDTHNCVQSAIDLTHQENLAAFRNKEHPRKEETG